MRFRFLMALIAGLSLGAAAIPAQALVVIEDNLTEFTFTGLCDDCAEDDIQNEIRNYEPVSGTLVVRDFVPGEFMDTPNFVSFTYNGSSLVDPFTVTESDVTSFFAQMMGDGTLFDDGFFLTWDGVGDFFCAQNAGECAMTVLAGGFWQLGDLLNAADFGIDGRFAIVTDAVDDTPEPATLALLGAGLAGLGWARRRRR